MGVLKRCSLSIAVVGAVLAAAPQAHAQGAIITNGKVSLGVNPGGALNVSCDPLATLFAAANPRCAYLNGGGDPSAINFDGRFTGSGVGVMNNRTLHEFTYDGCTCEGWGAGYTTGGPPVSDGEDTAFGSPADIVSFTSDGVTATSVVRISGSMLVTQFYHPSLSGDLYQVDVTLTNLTGGILGIGPDGIRYRRLMDWDVEPTAFDEYVTIHGNGATALLGTSDDGIFPGPNPFDPPDSACNGILNADFYHSGPCDHGALFDFGFPELGPGDSRAFSIFYGVAANEATALADLGLVNADDVYSFGQFDGCTPGDDACIRGEETAIFAFKGVGGLTLGTPEPATFALLGTGLVGLAGFARRRRRVEQN